MRIKNLLILLFFIGITTVNAQNQNIITTYAGIGITYNNGDGGQASVAQIDRPESITFDANGDMYLSSSSAIRKITVSTNVISTPIKGLSKLHGVAIYDGNIYFCD